MKNILIVLGHNNFANSKVNKEMISKAQELKNVRVLDIYKKHQNTIIGKNMDVKKISEDKDLLLNADIIIYQFPYHWYTSPPLLDYWIEYALSWGWAFGSQFALKDKITTVAFTAGEIKEDYTSKGRSLFDASIFVKRFEATASYCKMKWIKNFSVIGASHIDEAGIKKEAEKYKDWLIKISQ